ncbi:MAG: hypothetical protein M1434_07200 [Chloroflexi bacterium]|nr:hypothetical protein [Chloroflexota bacterium]MCL5274518.1 hypothetical protein [Chloroflexota bacterium]
MVSQQLDWARLVGQTFLTSQGARFTVVKVTAAGVSIRPERARRTYSVSIPNELERLLSEFAAGTFFPSPNDLIKVGVRHERSSYIWGILHAVLVDRVLGVAPHSARPKSILPADFAGRWRITSMPNFTERWLTEGTEPAHLEFATTKYGYLDGEYSLNYSRGSLEGSLRGFGVETILLFSFDGVDEMEHTSGAGWVRLINADQLAGEFLNDYGEFSAIRDRMGAGGHHGRYKAIRMR